MDELNEVDEDELLAFESELIKHLKRTDIVADLSLEARCRRMRNRVMMAVEEESSPSSNATTASVTSITALRATTRL